MRAATIIAAILIVAGVVDAETGLRRDKDGWTVFTPAQETHVLYVSSTDGDDATGKPYAAGAPDLGEDPFLPLGTVRSFQTLAAALGHVRPDHSDWVLLKRGDTWEGETLGIPSFSRCLLRAGISPSATETGEGTGVAFQLTGLP